jgi:trimethylamine--corrinoid protein Co-methyltransferase
MMTISAQGCEVSDETMALDLIKRLGPGGQYLTEKHTIKHIFEYYIPKISDRTSWEHWKSTGQSKDAREKAREKARQILKTHEVKPLERSVREEISQILRRQAD